MKEIRLTQGQVALVDDSDYEYLNQFKWQAQKDNNTYYAVRHAIDSKGNKCKKIMHREIMSCPVDKVVDHINHNGLCNVKENLRICSRSENQRNRSSERNSTSKFLGVYFRERRRKYIKKNGEVSIYYSKRWHAAIKINGRQHHLGTFFKETEAAIAYNNKSSQEYGTFANLNKIE